MKDAKRTRASGEMRHRNVKAEKKRLAKRTGASGIETSMQRKKRLTNRTRASGIETLMQGKNGLANRTRASGEMRHRNINAEKKGAC